MLVLVFTVRFLIGCILKRLLVDYLSVNKNRVSVSISAINGRKDRVAVGSTYIFEISMENRLEQHFDANEYRYTVVCHDPGLINEKKQHCTNVQILSERITKRCFIFHWSSNHIS